MVILKFLTAILFSFEFYIKFGKVTYYYQETSICANRGKTLVANTECSVFFEIGGESGQHLSYMFFQ
jgi:hypothetical protein